MVTVVNKNKPKKEKKTQEVKPNAPKVTVRPTNQPNATPVDVTGLDRADRNQKVYQAFPELSPQQRAIRQKLEGQQQEKVVQQQIFEEQAQTPESLQEQEAFLQDVALTDLAPSELEAELQAQLASKENKKSVFGSLLGGITGKPGVLGTPTTTQGVADQGARAGIGALAGLGGLAAASAMAALGTGALTSGTTATTTGLAKLAAGSAFAKLATGLTAASFISGIKATDVVDAALGRQDLGTLQSTVGKFGEHSSSIVSGTKSGAISPQQAFAELEQLDDTLSVYREKMATAATLRPSTKVSDEYNNAIAEIDKIRSELRSKKGEVLATVPQFNPVEIERLIAQSQKDEDTT